MSFVLCGALVLPGTLSRGLVLLTAGFLLSTNASVHESATFAHLHAALGPGNHVELTGTVTTFPQKAFDRYSFVLSAECIETGGRRKQLHRKSVLCRSAAPPPLNSRLRCAGYFRLPRAQANPGSFDERLYLVSNHLWGILYADSVAVLERKTGVPVAVARGFRRLVHATADLLPDLHHRGVLLAAFLGEKGMLASTTKELYRTAGIYHLLAISGLHVGILIAAVLLVLAPLPLPRTAKTAVTLAVVWAYLLFIGPIPSLCRAVVMATVVLLATVFQRRAHPLNALGLAGIVWLSFSPLSLFTPGYQLSFAATLGILALYPPINTVVVGRLPEGTSRLVFRPVISLALVSLIGFLATAPVLLYHFGTLSPGGLLANMLAVLLMGIAMNLFFFAVAANAFVPFLAPPAMRVAGWALSGIESVAALTGRLVMTTSALPRPSATLIIAYVTALLCVAAARRKHLPRVAASALAVFVLVAMPAVLIVHDILTDPHLAFLSTRRGSLTAVRFPNGKIWVVGNAPEDGAVRPWRNALGPWLRTQLGGRFDAMVLPRLTPNVVHDLKPIAAGIPPASVVVPGPLDNGQATEDFRGFLHEYGIKLVVPRPGSRFVPAPRCTVTIGTAVPRPGTSREPPDATVLISLDGVRLALLPEDGGRAEDLDVHLYRRGNHIRPKRVVPGPSVGSRQFMADTKEGAVILRVAPGSGPIELPPRAPHPRRAWREGRILAEGVKRSL